MPYSHITFGGLKAELIKRLGDSVFWTDDDTVNSEIGSLLIESLRIWGALTWRWKERVTLNLEVNVHWYELYAKIGRLSHKVTDQQLLTEIAYHFFEPVDSMR